MPASRPGVTNARYICGPAQDALPPVVDALKDSPAVGVCDPPRGGLRMSL
jgi:hypothetical protein